MHISAKPLTRSWPVRDLKITFVNFSLERLRDPLETGIEIVSIVG